MDWKSDDDPEDLSDLDEPVTVPAPVSELEEAQSEFSASHSLSEAAVSDALALSRSQSPMAALTPIQMTQQQLSDLI